MRDTMIGREMSEPLIAWDMIHSLRDLGVRKADPTFSVKIINLFEVQSDQMLGKMDKAFQEKNLQELEQVAHCLKGSALCIGANRLAELCRQIEQEIRDKKMDVSSLSKVLELVRATFVESIAALRCP